MDIVFYNNASDENVINKSISQTGVLSGSLKDPFNVESPRLIVENTGVINANYCFIDVFGRYYFIDSQTVISNKRLQLDLRVDVLTSFKDAIGNMQAIIENSTSDNDNYLMSDIWKTKVKTKTDVLQFTGGFNNTGEYILITAGG